MERTSNKRSLPPSTPPNTPPSISSQSTPTSSPETKRRKISDERPTTPPRSSNQSRPGTPERSDRDYNDFRAGFQPPSIKQERRDAIRNNKQNAQFPAGFMGSQLFPPDFNVANDMQILQTQNSQARKYKELQAQASQVRDPDNWI